MQSAGRHVSLICGVPTIIVAVFSYLFFSFGVDAWLSDKCATAISESVAVGTPMCGASAGDPRRWLAMGQDLDRSASTLVRNRNISRGLTRRPRCAAS